MENKNGGVPPYQKKLEDFRKHYFEKFGIRLDDEILYFFIRVNEMQGDLKKEINAIPKLTLPNKWAYFIHGLGKYFLPSILISSTMIFLMFACLEHFYPAHQNFQIVCHNKRYFVEFYNHDTVFQLPIKPVQ